jgi:hypothetical protein
MKKLLYLFTFALMFTGCKSNTTETKSALGAVKASSCLIGKWSDSRLPLNIKISSDFSGDITAGSLVAGLNPLEQMAKAWNTAASPKTLITIPFPATANTGYADTASYRDGEIGIYKSQNWFTNVQSQAIAITQYYGVVTSSEGLGQYIDLTHADIIINYRDYGPELTMNINPTYDYDLPTVVLHEMGHLVGLCHESTQPSIMDPYYNSTQRSLKTYDNDIIKDIYIDGAITKNSNTSALSLPEGTEVRGVIELHADGNCVHYMNGKKTFEHIIDKFKKKNLAQK